MQLSTSTNICAFRPDGGKNGFDFCIEQCAKAGYKVLDLNFCEAMNPTSRLRDEDWEDYVIEIGELAKRWGVTFSQSHLPYYDIFGTTDMGKIELMETLIRRSILATGMLGIPWTVTHPGTAYGTGPGSAASLQKNLGYYAPHVALAKQAGVGIALENDFEYKTTPWQRIFASDVTELCELVDAFGSENVGVCYDFGHANLTGGFHRANLNAIGKRLKAVHVQDNLGTHDDHLLPFCGTTDWADAMAGLADIGYDYDLTYEIQEFGRYFPNDMKHLVVELSITVGNRLLELYEQAKRGAPKAE